MLVVRVSNSYKNRNLILAYLSTDTSETRLYVIRNEEPGEACLNQVKAK